MQDKINNKEQDPFNEVIRQKLENHQLPVNPECWNEIEERLKSKKRRIIPIWFWITGGAAVATLTLLFTLRSVPDSKDFIVKSKSTNFKTENPQSKYIAKQQILPTLATKKTQSKQFSIHEQSLKKRINTITENELAQIHKISSVTTVNNHIINTNTGNLKDQSTEAEVTIENKESINVKRKDRIIPNSLTEKTIEKPIVQAKNKASWLLAAAVESGGGMDLSSSNGNLLANNGNALTTANSSFTDIKTANDFSQKNYLPPFSIGLTIRKKLDKSISIESGLVYTYLVSTFSNTGTQHNDANLKLHYLGIPINLVVKLWNNQKWEIYISGGPMAEKGLRSIYTQNEYSGGQTNTTIAKTGIDGIQWSLNGAIGVSYKLQKNLGIYFEPKLSNFFNNNQPVSARTEYPVVFGLSVGLRYQLR